ncbi:DUF354 domain-containing protein [Qipengyuania sp. 1NDH17]|uniref:DUF354 domain-containing protein n=1 Tax=Qipengyuania polymorpha TaxID=2867234 RepID=A0ABS7IW10_9SPHN|nr:DUF354 domain-containing protein [Qipengyuania polymorpha]MBX7457696.1 DUF354 domain-containing protein [Qipengyuania polymorpha]
MKLLRILIDIVHPADVLFFLRPIRFWQERGDELLVLSRHKDVTCDLLDEFGIAHIPVTTASKGLLGLGSELLKRSFATWQHARRFRPDVMLGFGGVSISHAGKLLGVPALSFYDTENATLQAKVTWPFITHVYVPENYTSNLPQGRVTKLPGAKELSYLHPAGFMPDREKAVAAGFDPKQDNYLVRLVAWNANHDIGKQGWDEATLRAVIKQLPGKVHISSEVPLPADLEPLLYRGKFSEIHHLMGCCRLFVGESASMAAEAAVLGVPSIYAADFRLGYIDELVGAGLMQQVPVAQLPEAIDRGLAIDPSRQAERRDTYVASKVDWAKAVIEAADAHGEGGRT